MFGSQAKSLKDAMLGEELPPPLELRKKRSRSVRIMKKDSRSIKTVKLTIFLNFIVCYLILLSSTIFRFVFLKSLLSWKPETEHWWYSRENCLSLSLGDQ